jgi:hypothetical protein
VAGFFYAHQRPLISFFFPVLLISKFCFVHKEEVAAKWFRIPASKVYVPYVEHFSFAGPFLPSGCYI